METSSKDLSCCGILFTSRRALQAHQSSHIAPIQCNHCRETFTRQEHLSRHTKSCYRKRKTSSGSSIKVKKIQLATPPPSEHFNIRLVHRGMEDLFKIYRAQFKRIWNDISSLTVLLASHIIYLIQRAVLDTDGVKAQLRCSATFTKSSKDKNGEEQDIEKEWHFISKQMIHLHSTETSSEYAKAMAEIHKKIQEFVNRGSGWSIKQVNHLDLYISKYRPIRGRSFCNLPTELKNTKAIVNPQNDDEQCFIWSILAKISNDEFGAVRNPQRISHYKPLINRLSMDGFQFPMQIDDIPRFEENNGLAINVFGYGSTLFPLYATKSRCQDPINLLLLTPDNTPAHYCWIKNLDKLLFQSTAHKGKKYICNYCLCAFNSEKRLSKHHEYCTSGHQRIEMPEDTKLKFKNFNRMAMVPYVMYADFECFIQNQDNGKKRHVPNSYGVLGARQCCGGADFDDPVVYRGKNPVAHFLETIILKGEDFQKELSKPMKMGAHDFQSFKSSSECHICDEKLDERVRDHCHICGRFRGAAHSSCNTKMYQSKDVIVFFHNLRRYDGHLIMQNLGSVAKERGFKLDCVAKSAEDYLSFKIGLPTSGKRWNIRFVDSMSFLPASLETLTKNLPKDKFTAFTRFTKYPNLLLRKGVYPYEFMDNEKKFDLQHLPPTEAFYNKLKLENISQQDYRHAETVWSTHQFETMGQYHDLYLKTDILLLADIFQGFRQFSLTNYGLDPAHYITLPSMAWDALLKMTKVELELLSDPDMYQFFQAGIRGGTTTISHRHAKANNEKMENYDAQEPKSHIMYWDANNLYGWAMQLFLPVGKFEWIEGPLYWLPNKEDGIGYVWEVDLQYPKDLHEKHNDYPMAPEKIMAPELSPYCKLLQEKSALKEAPMEKLIPNLMDKERYIIHHRNLDQCLEQGLLIKKIHRGIKFEEQAWMAPYIQFNTEMRKTAKDDFDKDLFKLLNNAVFGKSMENVFNHIDFRLVADPQKYEKLVASPLYKESHAFTEDLTGVMMQKEKATLNRPIYTGFSILELSKTLMYDFHYNYVQERFPKARLLFTDTDSLCYHIEDDNLFEKLLQDRDRWFDTSEYPANHPLHSIKNKKRIGYMKDEKSAQVIVEFVGLKAKLYSLKTEDGEHKRAKGITRPVVREMITHADYLKTQKEGALIRHDMTTFRSKDHQIYTVNTNKVSLSAFDDKRYILEDGTTTLAYGHKKIPVSTTV